MTASAPPPARAGVLLHAAASGFEAARCLDGLPAGHRAGRLHGHSFSAQVRCALPPGWAGFAGGELDRLAERLGALTARLDHRCLDDELPQRGDAAVARWLHGSIDAPGVARVGVRAGARRGAEIGADGAVHVWRRYALQAAHRLPNVRPGHKCGRMHGHGFGIVVRARCDAGADDAAAEAAGDRIDRAWAPLHRRLDHACLNDFPGLENPTSELLASWLWQRLAPALEAPASVSVYETASCGACFDGGSHRIWKDFGFDSAVRLAQAPEGDALARLHGHTFGLRLHLAAPLDRVLGWAVDFGDVKELFAPVVAALDHRPLHEIGGLDGGDPAAVARWSLAEARRRLPQVCRVDLWRTPGCGVLAEAGAQQADGAMP